MLENTLEKVASDDSVIPTRIICMHSVEPFSLLGGMPTPSLIPQILSVPGKLVLSLTRAC